MKKVCVFFADGMEECEALITVDILRRANIIVDTVSINSNTKITSSHNVSILADKTINEENFDDIDMIVLPGGMPGTTNLRNNAKVCELAIQFSKAKKVAAICAAPSILGELGLLNGKRATVFPGFEKYLTGSTNTSEKVTVDGNIITAKGMGTAIDFSLEIIKMLINEEKANSIASAIQYY